MMPWPEAMTSDFRLCTKTPGVRATVPYSVRALRDENRRKQLGEVWDGWERKISIDDDDDGGGGSRGGLSSLGRIHPEFLPTSKSRETGRARQQDITQGRKRPTSLAARCGPKQFPRGRQLRKKRDRLTFIDNIPTRTPRPSRGPSRRPTCLPDTIVGWPARRQSGQISHQSISHIPQPFFSAVIIMRRRATAVDLLEGKLTYSGRFIRAARHDRRAVCWSARWSARPPWRCRSQMVDRFKNLVLR